MHCNFDITPDILEKLDTLPGIETIDVFSRYRLRVSIGKCFDESEVKESQETILSLLLTHTPFPL